MRNDSLAFPLIIGHRGASAEAPENTMAAFHRALEAGADGIEFDVRLSRDRIPFVIHDENLKRTGLDSRRVAALSAAELKQIDVGKWFDPVSFTNERIPMLKEVLDLFEPTSSILYLEMKSRPSDRMQLAETCCEMLNSSPVKPRVVVESFDLRSIQLVKDIDSTIRTAALFEPRIARSRSRDGASLIDEAQAVSANEIALHHRLASASTLALARRAGLGTVVWTVDDAGWISRAISDGIDSVITNDPNQMVRQRGALQARLKLPLTIAYSGHNDSPPGRD